MTIEKPYKRIARPFQISSNPSWHGTVLPSKSHIADPRYASGQIHSNRRAFQILEKDLIQVFEYIEPADKNRAVHSHRLYALLLRACTEFEANCKSILIDNQYLRDNGKQRGGGNANINDYRKINQPTKLSEYEVRIPFWSVESGSTSLKTFKPMDSWDANQNLNWYQSYNEVKHNRHDQTKFKEHATLENVIRAIGGVFVILFAQFNTLAFNNGRKASSCSYEPDGWITPDNSIFMLKPPQSWEESDCYNFDWKTLKRETNPYTTYTRWS